jgi:hypothetical protein
VREMDRNGRLLRTWGEVRVKGRVGTREGTDGSSMRSSTDLSFSFLVRILHGGAFWTARVHPQLAPTHTSSVWFVGKCESHGRFISQSSILS